MGSTKYKVSYTCECGCDYGICGKTNVFLLDYLRSCDIARLYHKTHEEENNEFEFIGCYGDEAVEALVKILTQKEPTEKWTEEEKKQIDKL